MRATDFPSNLQAFADRQFVRIRQKEAQSCTLRRVMSDGGAIGAWSPFGLQQVHAVLVHLLAMRLKRRGKELSILVLVKRQCAITARMESSAAVFEKRDLC
nr:hypothetical protein Iba_chr12dCG15870 [Ipomoea batatas]